MPAQAFVEALNIQIENEFAASQQYVACAVYYDTETLPQLAGFFYRQAVEERNHAMMMVQYLLDAGGAIAVPGTPAPQTEFADFVAPVKLALEQEKDVSKQIGDLVRVAREQNDYVSEQFIGWFLREQVEEVATASALLDVASRCANDPMRVEEYVAREHSGGGGEPAGAPEAAGGAL